MARPTSAARAYDLAGGVPSGASHYDVATQQHGTTTPLYDMARGAAGAPSRNPPSLYDNVGFDPPGAAYDSARPISVARTYDIATARPHDEVVYDFATSSKLQLPQLTAVEETAT
jgi:hypothetical protein